VAAAACALTACGLLGPHYARPDIPPPQTWRNAPAVDSVAAWPSAQWWEGFDSLTLNQLIEQARTANDDIAAAIARIRQADAQVRIAGAPLLPTLDAGAQATRQRAKTTALSPGGRLSSTPATFNTFNAQLSASYQVDFWGRNWALRDAARMAAVASRYDRVTVELGVMTSVATTYFQALELHDRLKVAQDNVASARDILKGLQLEAQVGVITALDVAQQETTVATLEAAIPPLQQQLAQTIDALAILVGKQPEAVAHGSSDRAVSDDRAVSEGIPNGEGIPSGGGLDIAGGTLADLAVPRVGPGMPSELLTRRPDVAQAEAQLVAANADIAAARAAFFPSINLTAEGGYASTALSTLVNPANRIFSIGAGLTQPIFHGGEILGQYQLNKARYQELLADYHKAVIAAFGNVEDALVAVQQSAEQLQRQQQAVATARHAYELTQAQFHAGTINILVVLSTETALFTAEDTLVQVKYSHLNALVALFGALGGGWQRT